MQSNRVAVYGSLRSGFGNHRLLDNDESTFVGEEVVQGWGLYPYAGTGFPAAAVKEDAQVVVEVYDVSDAVFKRLDGLEGYPSFYDRTEVPLVDGTKAWMYFHHKVAPDLKRKLIEHGDWKKYVKEVRG